MPPKVWNNAWPDLNAPHGGPGAAGLPVVGFPATSVLSMWVAWKQLEPTEGAYDLRALYANLDEAVRRGWRVGIRVLTSRSNEAAPYLAGRGIATKYGGSSYDPADPRFHARYLALLDAMAAAGLCHNESVAMMYVAAP